MEVWWLTQQTSVHVIKSFHSLNLMEEGEAGEEQGKGKSYSENNEEHGQKNKPQTDKGAKEILEAESNNKLSFERGLASTRDTPEKNQALGKSGCASPLSGAQVPITSPLPARCDHPGARHRRRAKAHSPRMQCAAPSGTEGALGRGHAPLSSEPRSPPSSASLSTPAW